MGSLYTKLIDSCKKLTDMFTRNRNIPTEQTHIEYKPPNINGDLVSSQYVKNSKDKFDDYSYKSKYIKNENTDKNSNISQNNSTIINIFGTCKVHKLYYKKNLTENLANVTNENYFIQKLKPNDFKMLKLLGKGTFGKVLLVRSKFDNKLYAMKILKKEKIFKTKQIDHTKTERDILAKITHPFIIKLHFSFQTIDKLFIVTEFIQGGELFFHLKKEKIFNERKTKTYACEIILAIEHLHKNKIIYRDLKPENILIDIDGHIKLTDFGLSKFFNSNHNDSDDFDSSDKAFTLCGTPQYLAPEILLGNGYDKSVDWWSLGVIIYEMLCGTSPFKNRRIRKLSIDYYKQPIEINNPTISENAKNLIFSLLKTNPEMRISSANLIKSHSFFKDIDWDSVYNKKTIPDFVPYSFLKSEYDLSCFDTYFTDMHIDDSFESENELETMITVDKYIDNDRVNQLKKMKDDFRNFSFIREGT